MCMTHLVLRFIHAKGCYWCTVYIEGQRSDAHPRLPPEPAHLPAHSLTPRGRRSCSSGSTALASLPWVWRHSAVSPLCQSLKQEALRMKLYIKNIYQHKNESWQPPPPHVLVKRKHFLIMSSIFLKKKPRRLENFPLGLNLYSQRSYLPQRENRGANGSYMQLKSLSMLHWLWNFSLL